MTGEHLPEDVRERRFHLVLRQALLMIVAWIEREYGLERAKK